jgi:hypothetical protein
METDDEHKRMLRLPSKATATPILPSESCASYLQKCKNNLLAEVWALHESKLTPSAGNKHWRDATMTRVYFEWRDMPKVKCVYVNEKREETMDVQEIAWQLMLFGDSVYLLVPSKSDKKDGTQTLVMLRGRQVEDPHHVAGGEDWMHSLGYVKPYYVELKAICDLEAGLAARTLADDTRCMLRQAAAPSSRVAFSFAAGRGFSSAVPSNAPQRDVVQGLAHGIECIQGPPGTGKSTTIFHILSTRLPDDHKAIVTCVQNRAIDSIVEKLRTTGMPFVVYGNPSRLGEHAREYTVEAQVLRDPAVVAVRKEIDRAVAIEGLLRKRMELIANRKLPRLWLRWWQIYVETRHGAGLRNDCDRWFHHTQGLRKALVTVKTDAEVRILKAARAHLSTMDGLASASIPGDPKVAIIDEAGTVPEFKIPHLLSVGVRAIVAIGDQKQLQPFTHDQDASLDGYFQRAVRAIRTVPMLTIQYRMHPVVCDLVSRQFYDRKLQTAPPIAALRTADSANGLRWLDYPDAHAESRARDKKCNPVEVRLIERFMEEELPSLLAGGKTVAIITFYKHQLAQLMDAGRRAGCVRTEEEARRRKTTKKEAILQLTPSPFKHPNFRILTVDAAQGSEADVVVLSCVRCNPSGDIGFIKNNNRLCVALSRARERLCIVGSRHTLVRHFLWREVWQRSTPQLY